MGIQLPRWVWIGAIALSCVAGMVNVVGFLGFEHQAVSHLTGTTSQLGMALVQRDWRSVAHLWSMLIAFSLGAMLSGLIVQDGALRLGRRYGVVLTLESLLLLAAIPLFKQQQIWGALAAAMACGLPNAMATTFSGAGVEVRVVKGCMVPCPCSGRAQPAACSMASMSSSEKPKWWPTSWIMTWVTIEPRLSSCSAQ